MSFDETMLKFLTTYSNDAYYVGSAISQKRMQSAHKAHGVDPRDRVWAIIDSTILGTTSSGSADNGMSITASGIYWKNMWAIRTRLNHYSWTDFAAIAAYVEVGGGNIKFEPGVEFGAPAVFKAEYILNMLRSIVSLYVDHDQALKRKQNAVDDASTPQLLTSLISAPPGQHGYAPSLGRYLAVISCHAGPADEACVELATELLQEEEITHPGVLNAFAETIESLEKEHQRSSTFFRLKQARVLAEVDQLPEPEEERILIMCEALADVAQAPTATESLKKVEEVLRR